MKRELKKELKLLDELIEYMKKNDLTQQDVAISLEISVSTVARWLAGNNFPGPRARRKIKALLRKGK